MADREYDPSVENRRVLARNLDTAGWGLLFIWVGIALLANVGWGVGLLGVGIIGLGAQAARTYFSLPIEGTGLVVPILFVVAGVWELLKTNLGQAPIPGGLIPIFSIVVGVVLVLSTLWRRGR